MLRVLALLRHGLASGQDADAPLLDEGAAYLRRLGAMLEGEGWRPDAILASPLLRAQDTAAIVAAAVGADAQRQSLRALLPETDPDVALEAVVAAAPLASRILVVAHMPLLGRMTQELIGDDPGFSPGTLVEIAREGGGVARLLRRVGPRDVPTA
jgi:phosphohistidine phosphatase SixA